MIARQPPPKNATHAHGRDQSWQVPVLCLVLGAITFAVFGRTAGFSFVNFDDNIYVYENAHIAGGLSLKGLAWVFTHVEYFLYLPLTSLSLMADYQFHGLHAGGYHLTNVVLHAASVIMLFLILRQMTGALWRSAFVAAVFAIHPLRVESVAWVSERKDVLSVFFFMLTLGAYVRYVRKPDSLGRYLMVAAAFVLALLSKPSVVTLPFVLLLLDYWPLNRFEKPRKLSGLILEKIPLLALAAGVCALTVLTEEGSTTLSTVSMVSRIDNALVSYATYLGEMFWPVDLAVFYPYPNSISIWRMVGAVVLLAAVSWAVIRGMKNRPYLGMGWFWYLGTLMPMLGILQVGGFAHADRYTYLPQIGIYIAVTWLVAEWRLSRVAFGCLMTGVIAVLMVCAWKQTSYWENAETLWTRALDCTTGNFIAHGHLGNVFLQKGETKEAIPHFQEALEINPDYVYARNNFGNALLQEGRVDDAITQYQEALKTKPDYADAQDDLGVALFRKGRVDEAIAHYEQALRLNPDEAEFYNNLGLALSKKGRMDDAITQYQTALKISPGYMDARALLGNAFLQEGRVDDAIAQYQETLKIKPGYADVQDDLGVALFRKGRLDDAIAHYEQALQLNPDAAEFHNNLGLALSKKGRVDDAITQYQETLKISPDYVDARFNLGLALSRRGRTAEAITQYREALQIGPAEPKVQNNLAEILATCSEASLRNGARAVELARQANALTGGENPIILRTLAAGFAEAGRFSEAMETAKHALRLAEAQTNANLSRQLQLEMKLYQAGQPYHVPEQAH